MKKLLIDVPAFRLKPQSGSKSGVFYENERIGRGVRHYNIKSFSGE